MGARLPLACCLLLSILVHMGNADHGSVAVVTDTNSSHAGGRHLLSHGITCDTAINLASYPSPLTNMGSSDKTNFLSSCGSGYDAIFYYWLPPGATIAFYPPSSYSHTTHEIRYSYGGSCPGELQASCVSAGTPISLRSSSVTQSADIYYIQSGFPSADSNLNVVWSVTSPGLFAVESGACTVSNSAMCFRSPNFPSNYDNYQQCTITVGWRTRLSVTAFSTESGFDPLTVNGMSYSGTSGPDGVWVAAGTTITFTSDGSSTRSGFEICGVLSSSISPPPPRPPPSPPPPRPPPSPPPPRPPPWPSYYTPSVYLASSSSTSSDGGGGGASGGAIAAIVFSTLFGTLLCIARIYLWRKRCCGTGDSVVVIRPAPIAVVINAPGPAAAPVATQMQVTLPPVMDMAGQQMQVQTPSGEMMTVTVPADVPPGGQFTVTVPAPTVTTQGNMDTTTLNRLREANRVAPANYSTDSPATPVVGYPAGSMPRF